MDMFQNTIVLRERLSRQVQSAGTARSPKHVTTIHDPGRLFRSYSLSCWIVIVAVALFLPLPILAQTAAYPGQLPIGTDCDSSGEAPYNHPPIVAATTGKGVGIAVTDLAGGTDVKDLILIWHDGSNFLYRVAREVHGDGATRGWTPPITVGGTPPHWPHIGYCNVQNVSATVGDIDGNGTPDLILVLYASFDTLIVSSTGVTKLLRTPSKFYYRIGWNLDAGGVASSWSGFSEVAGVNSDAQGVGAALADINQDGRLDLVLLAYATSYPKFRYRIGWDLQPDGTITRWGAGYAGVPGFGEPPVRGAGIAIGDFDLDGTLDALFLAHTLNDQSGLGTFRYKIAWSLRPDGTSTKLSRDFHLKQLGANAAGAGVAYGQLFSFDPSGNRFNLPHVFITNRVPTASAHELRISALPLTTSGTAFGSADDYLPPWPNSRPDTLSVPSSADDESGDKLFNLNRPEVQSAAWDAVASFISHCQDIKTSGGIAPECLYHSSPGGMNFVDVINGPGFSYEACPDCLVAAVAWYVDKNMGWVEDEVNAYVLNDIFSLGYAPGGEAMPAYYTIKYTDPTTNPNLIAQLQTKDPNWATKYNDGKIYHGDCEDFAILRHALLRALAFDRRFVWNVRVPHHEFNVVLYGGSYRIMDYGSIYRYLCSPNGGEMNAAWNQVFGPRLGSQTGAYLKELVLPRAYPDRCGVDNGWLFTRFARPEFDNWKECCP